MANKIFFIEYIFRAIGKNKAEGGNVRQLSLLFNMVADWLMQLVAVS